MTVQTLKIGNQKFVLVRKVDFDHMRTQAERQSAQDKQDSGDIAEIRRRKGRGSSKPYSELRHRLGLG